MLCPYNQFSHWVFFSILLILSLLFFFLLLLCNPRNESFHKLTHLGKSLFSCFFCLFIRIFWAIFAIKALYSTVQIIKAFSDDLKIIWLQCFFFCCPSDHLILCCILFPNLISDENDEQQLLVGKVFTIVSELLIQKICWCLVYAVYFHLFLIKLLQKIQVNTDYYKRKILKYIGFLIDDHDPEQINERRQ